MSDDDLPIPVGDLSPEEYVQWEREQKAVELHMTGGIEAVMKGMRIDHRQASLLYEQALFNKDRRATVERLRAEQHAREDWMIEKLMPAVAGEKNEDGEWIRMPSTNAAKAITSIHDRQSKRYATDKEQKSQGPQMVVITTPPFETGTKEVIVGVQHRELEAGPDDPGDESG